MFSRDESARMPKYYYKWFVKDLIICGYGLAFGCFGEMGELFDIVVCGNGCMFFLLRDSYIDRIVNIS